jgi:hypothetical protein
MNSKVNLIILFPILVFITACKIDFNGDLYTSDLIDVAENGSESTLPMEVGFQVSSCEDDLTSFHNTLSGYFIDYNFLKCGYGDDFMSYVTSRVQVPLTNDQDSFNKLNNSLVGYLSTKYDNSENIYVYLILNTNLFSNLSDFVETETFSPLSLEEGKFIVNLNNDINDVSVDVYPSYVDSKPIVMTTNYKLTKREMISISNSNVSSAHLQKNSWTPIFVFLM